MGDILDSSQSSLSAPPSHKEPDPLGSNCFFFWVVNCWTILTRVPLLQIQISSLPAFVSIILQHEHWIFDIPSGQQFELAELQRFDTARCMLVAYNCDE